MKSNKEQLEKRGFLSKEFNTGSYDLSLNEKFRLLQSKIPTDRTFAARLLKNENEVKNVIEHLIKALIIEKKLYVKIEISNTLISYGKLSVKPLIKVLGEIGNNQHKVVPEKEFKKKNYPLPRDISSRILAHIGKNALPELLNNLERLDIKQQLEAIDAVGFICFYDYCPNTYELLKKCYLQNSENELIKWKIIRALSGFAESENFLEIEKINHQNKRLKEEIKRSVSLIKKRIEN